VRLKKVESCQGMKSHTEEIVVVGDKKKRDAIKRNRWKSVLKTFIIKFSVSPHEHDTNYSRRYALSFPIPRFFPFQ
jgi:hypothetical protein